MKNYMQMLAVMALGASSLMASPMPEKADLLAENTVVAQYMGLLDIPCRHMTADCPDKCDHATKVARFRVLKNENYRLVGKYGDDKMEPASMLMVDVKKPTPGQDDAAVFEAIDSLKLGDKVRLTQKHYYGDFGHEVAPFRPVTQIEKVASPDKVPACPEAPAGDYSVAPIAR